MVLVINSLSEFVTFSNSAVEAKGSEVVMNSQATISCVTSGLTQQLDAVTWEKPDGGGVITHNVDGYKIEKGSYDTGSYSQTTVLTIPADKNTADSVYMCIITSNEHAVSAAKTEVHSNVFSKCSIYKCSIYKCSIYKCSIYIQFNS